MLKFRRFLYLSGSFLLLLVKFAVDIIRMNVEMDMGGLMFLRELAAAGAFFLIFLTLQASVPSHAVNPARRLGVFLFIAAVFMIGAGLMGFLPADGFDAKEFTLRPLDYASLFLSSLFGLLAGIFAMVTLRFLHDLVLMYQKKSTVRNFQIFIGQLRKDLAAKGGFAALTRTRDRYHRVLRNKTLQYGFYCAIDHRLLFMIITCNMQVVISNCRKMVF